MAGAMNVCFSSDMKHDGCLKLQYLVPFLLNLGGSALYYVTLGDVGKSSAITCVPNTADLSLGIPLNTSLTLLFTFLAGQLLGEKSLSPRALSAIGLIIGGICVCTFM